MKTVLIGITGGIAAVKIPVLISNLKKLNIKPIVLLTHSAAKIISRKQIKAKTFDNFVFHTHKVLKNRTVDHITLAKSANLFVIAPATANCIAKLAHGIADDYVTTTALAVRCPIFIFPSMNTAMWNHPATQRNISTLRMLGYIIFEPATGKLACGDEGKGRLPNVSVIEKEIITLLTKSDKLKGKLVIITSGGTMEKIDDIRFITNKSSGRMGAALADACYLRGARVILFRSQTSVSSLYPHKEQLFESADELEQLLKKYLPHADICIHAAAVSDYSVKHPRTGKTSSNTPLPLELTPRTKILDTIKKINPDIFLVAFKAEWNVSRQKLVSLASTRLKKSGADMIVANDISTPGVGIGSDESSVEIIDSNAHVAHVPRAPKTIIASKIIDRLVTEMARE